MIEQFQTTLPLERLGNHALVDRDIVEAATIRDGTSYVGLEYIDGESAQITPKTVLSGELASSKHRFTPSHILYGKLRPYLKKIACPSFAGICSTDIIPILPGPTADRNYLCHLLRHPHFVNLATLRSQGANLPRLSPRQLEEFEVPLPPLEDQKRIAVLLDKADALRRKRQEALRLTDDFLRSTFLDLFGDPDKHGWPMETVEDMLAARPNAIRTGPFGSQLLHSEFVDSGIAVLGIDNAVQNEFRWGKPRFISEEKYEQLRRYTVHPGDVIITIMGTVGRCAIVPADIPTAINTKHLCCLTLDRSKCLPEFLHTYFLTHPIAHRYLGQSAKGAIMDGLNMGLIKALPVPKVPLHLQQRFSDIAKQVQKTALRCSKASQEAETLFSALQQRAFSGQL